MKWEIALVQKFNNNLIFKKKFKYKLPKDIDENFGLADPFIFKDYIFCEVLDNNLKNKKTYEILVDDKIYKIYHSGGIIVYAKIDDKLKFKKLNLTHNNKCHMSFPFIFEKKNEIYMIPESSNLRCVYLYKSIKFPSEWKIIRKLINNKFCYDSIYFNIDNIDYIFTTEFVVVKKQSKTKTKEKFKKEYNNYIFYSNNITKKRIKILQRNIISKKYRGGGNVFYENNKLCIPIQPYINGNYGEKLYIYSIKKKENNRLEFIFEYELNKPMHNIYGMHNLSNYNNEYLIDFFY